MYKPTKQFTPAQIAAKAHRTGVSPILTNGSVMERIENRARLKGLNSGHVKQKGTSIDQQIFTDVYSAEELCLTVAQNFINGAKPFDDAKFDRLLKLGALGFSNAEEVKEALAFDKKLTEQKAKVEQIKEYQRIYPMHKFIDSDGVEELCKKYGLLLTGVDKYKADIPEKNQNDIINFKVMEKHVREATELNTNFFTWSDMIGGFDYYRPRRLSRPLYPNIVDTETAGAEGLIAQIQPKSDMVMAMGMAMMAQKETAFTSGKNLCILAPERMLITHNNMKKGHILLNDPIPLQPVHYGYLIITSWGLEAADQSIINPKHN